MSNKRLLVILVAIIIVLSVFIILKAGNPNKSKQEASPALNSPVEDSSARVVSTKPDPLEDTIIGANQPIEITFNKPLQNVGEFKSRIEPKVDYKVTLSSDRKTATLNWTKPLDLGTTYTFFIGTDTKFDGVGAWGQEKIYHFKTIKYTGV